jgi:hypothetical protein
MIIIKGKKDVIAVQLQTFPLAEKIDYRYLGGLQEEDKSYGEKLNQKIRKTHPFHRMNYMGTEKPTVIRWMWNPKTGEMLLDSSQMHAITHAGYLQRLRGQGQTTDDFDLWLRGFYFPKTRELAIRTFNLEALFPRSQFAIRSEDDEKAYRWAAAEFSDKMQEYVKNMLEREIGKKFKKVHTNVDNQFLADEYREEGGTRW